MAADRRGRRFEPWPVALAAALLAMIGVCVAFWIVAARHPDAELLAAGERPGLSAPGAAEAQR